MVKGKLLKSAAPVLLLFLAACSRENIRITDLTVLPMTVTTSSAVLSWDNPDGTREGDVYEIWLDGQMAAQSRVTHITLDRLKASTDYKVKVRGIDAKGREGDFSRTVSFRTPDEGAIYYVTDFGAVPDGETLNTEAIQLTIDECPEGGIVRIPAGTFLSGAIFLRDNMTLELEKGAVLQGSGNPEDYPKILNRFEGWELETYASLINCGTLDRTKSQMTENVAIRGEGTVRGGGKALGDAMRRAAGDDGQGRSRGRLIQFLNCRNVAVDGLNIDNPPCWTIHAIYSENITCHNLNITSLGVPNGDGIDPDSCTDFYIVGCSFTNGDDCIAVKSGKNPEGNIVNIPTKGVYVSDCNFIAGHGISIGSEISGGVENVVVRECKAGALINGMQIKATRERGAYIRNVDVRDCALQMITIFNRLSYNNDGEAAPTPPKFSDFTFRRLDLRGADVSKPVIVIHSFEEDAWKTENVLFSDIVLADGSQVLMEPATNVRFEKVRTVSGKKIQPVVGKL